MHRLLRWVKGPQPACFTFSSKNDFFEGNLKMAIRKQGRFSRGGIRPSNRTGETRPSIANGTAAPVRKFSRPPLTEPFYVAVDRQLKSGHETCDAAEKAALGIKKRYPKLQVTVFDAKEKRHTLIEQSKLARGSNNNRRTEQATNSVERRRVPGAAMKH
jgi:hypothetical protein